MKQKKKQDDLCNQNPKNKDTKDKPSGNITKTKCLSSSSDSSSDDDKLIQKPSKTTGKKIQRKRTKNKEVDVKPKNKKSKRKCPSSSSDSDSDSPKKRKKVTHRKWSDEEIKLVKKHFQSYINKKINPGKTKCLEVLGKEPILQTRTWMQLNTYVNNIYKKK